MQLNISEIIFKSIILSFQTLWPFLLLFALFISIKIALMLYKSSQLSKAGMFDIDKMTGDEFERYLSILFEKLGYRVEIVGSHNGDYGTDLLIEKQGERTAVQAKRWQNPVGIKSIQEVYGSLHIYDATKALVVTNNYYTKQAKRLAETNNVELWNRDTLAKIILSTKGL